MAITVAVSLDDEEAVLLRLMADNGESVESVARRLIKRALRKDFGQLRPSDFEQVIGRALASRGYEVEHVGGAGDNGIDLIAHSHGESLAVQCKRYDASQPITPRQIREFLGAMTAQHACKGLFVTTSTYTSAAYEFGQAHGIELVDGPGLFSWLSQARNKPAPQTPRPSGISPLGVCSCGHVPTWVSDNPSLRGWTCPDCGKLNVLNRE